MVGAILLSAAILALVWIAWPAIDSAFKHNRERRTSMLVNSMDRPKIVSESATAPHRSRFVELDEPEHARAALDFFFPLVFATVAVGLAIVFGWRNIGAFVTLGLIVASWIGLAVLRGMDSRAPVVSDRNQYADQLSRFLEASANNAGDVRFALYLRAFALEWSGPERLLLETFDHVTPIVAIGDRSAEFVGSGRVGRVVSSDEDWQAMFDRLAKSAARIFVMPALRDGIMWEVRALRNDPALLNKTIFLVPPVEAARRSYGELRQKLFGEGVDMPEFGPGGGMFCLTPDGNSHAEPGFPASTSQFEGRINALDALREAKLARNLERQRGSLF